MFCLSLFEKGNYWQSWIHPRLEWHLTCLYFKNLIFIFHNKRFHIIYVEIIRIVDPKILIEDLDHTSHVIDLFWYLITWESVIISQLVSLGHKFLNCLFIPLISFHQLLAFENHIRAKQDVMIPKILVLLLFSFTFHYILSRILSGGTRLQWITFRQQKQEFLFPKSSDAVDTGHTHNNTSVFTSLMSYQVDSNP